MGADETMQPAQRPDTRLTYDDLLLLPDDGRRHELIDGEHYVSPSPNTRHQRLVMRLAMVFGNHLDAHPGQGEAFIAPFDVLFSEFDVVEPDLLFVAADQADIVTRSTCAACRRWSWRSCRPAPGAWTRSSKYRLFERVGVREYWLVDPELDLVKVCRRVADGTLPRVAELTAEAHDTLTTPVLPGLAVPLPQLFR